MFKIRKSADFWKFGKTDFLGHIFNLKKIDRIVDLVARDSNYKKVFGGCVKSQNDGVVIIKIRKSRQNLHFDPIFEKIKICEFR